MEVAERYDVRPPGHPSENDYDCSYRLRSAAAATGAPHEHEVDSTTPGTVVLRGDWAPGEDDQHWVSGARETFIAWPDTRVVVEPHEHTEPSTTAAGPVLTEEPNEHMLYVHDHGDSLDPGCRYEVCLTIAGERWFATETEARGALGEVQAAIDQRAYLRGLVDSVEAEKIADENPPTDAAAGSPDPATR